MGFKRCPGSSSFSQPKIEIIVCPACGGNAEIWSDEADGKCLSCGKTAVRTTTQFCVDWCPHAQSCLGETKYRKYQDLKAGTRRDALLAAIDEHFKDHIESRQLARRRMGIAEDLLRQEKLSNPNVVIAAALLYDIGRPGGTKASDRDKNSGLETVRKIMQKLGYPLDYIQEVRDILDPDRPDSDEENLNCRIVRNADLLLHQS